MNLFDLLFPLRCVGCGEWDVWLCEECRSSLKRAKKPLVVVEGIDELVVIYEYEGLMQKIVKAIKYRFCKELIGVVLDGVELEKMEAEMVVPIPLYWHRENWRGFNQAEILGGIVAERWGLPLEKCLRRIKATRAVAELEGDERKKEVEGVFEVTKEVKGKKIILVDDVFTSGATMGEAAKTLKQNGAVSVIGFALAS